MTDTSSAGLRANPTRPPIPGAATAARPLVEDHKARAAARLAEIRALEVDNGPDGPEIEEIFPLQAHEIPDGWSYEAKRFSVYNKEDPQYMATVMRGGWTPVPASRHPQLLYAGYIGETIIKDGMILVERPKVKTEEVRRKYDWNARAVVVAKEAAMSATKQPLGDQKVIKHSRSIGPVEIDE